MNTHLRTPALLAAALLLSVAATSCTGDDPDPDGSLSPAPTSTPSETSASPSPTPLSETEQAAQDVEALVRRYYEITDAIGQDADEPIRQLRQVMSGGYLFAEMRFAERQRRNGNVQIGDTKIRELVVDTLSIDGTPTAYVHVCWDVSDVDVVDPQGSSVVVSGRADRGWVNHTVTNTNWKTDARGGWRISGGGDMEKEPCAG